MGIVETCHTHKFYRHLFFWIIYFFPFETSATASCGYMLYVVHLVHQRGWDTHFEALEQSVVSRKTKAVVPSGKLT